MTCHDNINHPQCILGLLHFKIVSYSSGIAQSVVRVLNGKLIYVMKTTDSLTTKVNRLSQDLREVGKTL